MDEDLTSLVTHKIEFTVPEQLKLLKPKVTLILPLLRS
jgi:hypothetical protein